MKTTQHKISTHFFFSVLNPQDKYQTNILFTPPPPQFLNLLTHTRSLSQTHTHTCKCPHTCTYTHQHQNKTTANKKTRTHVMKVLEIGTIACTMHIHWWTSLDEWITNEKNTSKNLFSIHASYTNKWVANNQTMNLRGWGWGWGSRGEEHLLFLRKWQIKNLTQPQDKRHILHQRHNILLTH